MKCLIDTPEHVELLLAYCSRKLDPANTAVVENHIALCPACREFAAGQGVVSRALDNWEAPPVSADFDKRLYERIAQDAGWWDRMMRPLRPLLGYRGLPVTAAAAVLVAAGVLLERPSRIASPPVRPAQVETVAAEQDERALDEMEMIHEFSVILRPENSSPKM